MPFAEIHQRNVKLRPTDSHSPSTEDKFVSPFTRLANQAYHAFDLRLMIKFIVPCSVATQVLTILHDDEMYVAHVLSKPPPFTTASSTTRTGTSVPWL